MPINANQCQSMPINDKSINTSLLSLSVIFLCFTMKNPKNNLLILENKIKNSFSDVKIDINLLKEEIKAIKSILSETKANFVQKTKIEDRKIPLSTPKNSIGNNGVINDHQRSSTIINDANQCQSIPNNPQQSPTMINNPKQPILYITKPPSQPLQQLSLLPNFKKNEIKSVLSDLDQALTSTFLSLTDRELSIFISIYELSQAQPEVTYSDLAKKLSLSEPTVRGAVNSLLSKGVPVIKDRFFNAKATLSISEDFKKLNLLSKLLSLKSKKPYQKTLLDL